MKSIYKYQLIQTDVQTISVPMFARFLDIQVQEGNLCAWFEVDTGINDFKKIKFSIYGTGNPLPEQSGEVYLRTVQMRNGLVWHIYADNV